MQRDDLLPAAMPNERSFAAAQMVGCGSFDSRSLMIDGDGKARRCGIFVHRTCRDRWK